MEIRDSFPNEEDMLEWIEESCYRLMTGLEVCATCKHFIESADGIYECARTKEFVRRKIFVNKTNPDGNIMVHMHIVNPIGRCKYYEREKI